MYRTKCSHICPILFVSRESRARRCHCAVFTTFRCHCDSVHRRGLTKPESAQLTPVPSYRGDGVDDALMLGCGDRARRRGCRHTHETERRMPFTLGRAPKQHTHTHTHTHTVTSHDEYVSYDTSSRRHRPTLQVINKTTS